MTKLMAQYDLLRDYCETRRAWHVARDYATDPALSQAERAKWRKRQRLAGRRVVNLRQELHRQSIHREGV